MNHANRPPVGALATARNRILTASTLGLAVLLGALLVWNSSSERLAHAHWIEAQAAQAARAVSAYGALLQDLTRWAVVGLRYDLYDYNSDLLTRQRGRAVPADAKIHTISPLLGAVLPAGVVAGIRGRLVIQYDRVFDALGRDRRGVPTNLANDQVTVRVQVEF